LTHLFIRTIHFKKNSKVDFTLDKKNSQVIDHWYIWWGWN